MRSDVILALAFLVYLGPPVLAIILLLDGHWQTASVIAVVYALGIAVLLSRAKSK